MKETENEYIRSRHYELCKNTTCGADLLNFFYSKGVLSWEEKEIIESKTTSVGKSSEFYKIIQSKTCAFTLLLQGLHEAGHTGALQILAEPRETDEPAIEEIQKFVDGWLEELLSTSQAGSSSSKKRTKTNITFDVLPPVLSFTGRTSELERLHQMVLRSVGAERVAVVSQVTPVSGLGGIGKTQLAREYVRIKAKEFDGNVLWMNAESEQSLYDSFKRLAKEMLALQTKSGTGKELPAKDLAGTVYKYFKANKALLVMDNAENEPWLKQFMPAIGETSQIFILITSRNREWDRKMEILELEGLLEDEAVNLIQQELSIDKNDTALMEDARRLAQTLQCFPLALQQAIAYIYEQQITLEYSIKDYLKEFVEKQHHLLEFQEEQICNESFTATTATTWSITFDKIKGDLKNGWLASLILNVVAYLGADNIQRNLFYRIPSVKTDEQFAAVSEEQINKAVRLLVKYSMLNGRKSQSILSVHRLVQSVTQNQLAQEGLDKHFLELAIQLLHGSDEDDFPSENIGHALIVWRHAFKNNHIIQDYAWQMDQILFKMGEVGHHDEGLLFGNEALVKFKKVFGENHLDCLLIQRNIGVILGQQGYVDKAISIFQDILTKAKSLYGDDSWMSLSTKNDLGISLRQNGKNQEALNILRKLLEKRKTISGDNHSSTLITEENYGVTLLESGNLSEAEKIFQRIIEIYIGRGEQNSTDVLNLQFNLSTIYSRKGDNEKALEIRREVYEKLSPVWTKNIELFTAVCSDLGFSLNKVGKHEEAVKILEGNIEKIKKQLGSQHARTLEVQQRIGISHQGLGNLSKALEILQSVYETFVSLSGEDSLPSLFAIEDVAITLSLLGEHTQALSKFQEILPKLEDLLGKENLGVITTKWKFALSIERSGENLHTALDMLKQVLEN